MRHKSLTDECVRRYTINFGQGSLYAKSLNHEGHRETGATEVRAKGVAEPYSAGPFGFARGRTPLLFIILTTEF